MKLLCLLSLLFFNLAVTAQNSKITIVVKRVGADLKPDVTFSGEDGGVVTESSAIRDIIQKGGTLVLQTEQDIKRVSYQLQKRLPNNGSQSLMGNLFQSLANEAKFNYGRSGILRENNPLLKKENLKNPGAKLENLRILLKDSAKAGLPTTIDVLGLIAPFLVNTDTEKGDCDSCQNDVKDDTKKGIKVLYYDFNCKCFYKIKNGAREVINVARLRANSNDQLHLVIKNVNRYIYDVNVIANDIPYESDMPALFKNFFLGDSSKLLGTLMNSSVQSLDGSPDLQSKFEDFQFRLGDFVRKMNELKGKRLSAYISCEKFDCCKAKTISKEYEDLLNTLNELASDIKKLQILIAREDSRDLLSQNIEDLKKDFIDCKAKKKAFDKFVKFKTDKETAISKLDTAKDKEKIAALRKQIDDAKKDDCDDADELKIQINEQTEKLVLFKTIDAFQAGLPSEDEIGRLLLFVHSMIKSNGEYVTPPIPIKANALDLAIQIKPNDTSLIKKWNISPSYNDSFAIEIPVLWKPFLSFSSGSFISLGKSLLNKTYEWQVLPSATNNVTDSSRFILAESGYTAPPMGFAALVHMEMKALPNIGFGLSVGVGLTIEKTPRFGYLAGGSLFIGDRKQLALTGGLVAMQINKLKNNSQAIFDQQLIYKYKAPIEYYRELKTGGFLSLTYTLFNITKSNRSKSK